MNRVLFTFKVWLCVWILVTFLTAMIRWSGMDLPLALQTMLLSGVMVPAMVYVIIPRLR